MRSLLAALMLASLSVTFMLSGFRLYVDNSDSMNPTIAAGDVIIVKSTELSKMQSGDIVTAFVPEKNQLLTHRITKIGVEDGQYAVTTKGDANTGRENWEASKDAVVGKYVTRLPYAGYAVEYLKTIPGMITIVCLIGALLILPMKHKKKSSTEANTEVTV